MDSNTYITPHTTPIDLPRPKDDDDDTTSLREVPGRLRESLLDVVDQTVSEGHLQKLIPSSTCFESTVTTSTWFVS
ncbi:hypothetical protein PSTT_16994 [Puccinia striiformis]|uniref:Uncharacterized protein n=1 Tax=Puccinia striiformis TaxID=27350 RepID=A0A2S4UA61_9BASI|nr:hypothetical protein PSTT_16994 [Puccinia striiformis]